MTNITNNKASTMNTDNNGTQQQHSDSDMKLLIVILGVIIHGKSHNCFYFPQSYDVKMYHYQHLLMFGENNLTENSVFNLDATDEQGNKINENRRKRNSEESPEESNSNYFDEETMYQGSIEPKDNLQNNKSYDYNYEKFRNEYYQEESPQVMGRNQTWNDNYTDEEKPAEKIDLDKAKSLNITANSVNVPMENYCSVVLLFRIRVLQCLLIGLSERNDDIIHRASQVIAFWCIIYTIISSYLWCTRGWCCCCCPCSCCHPYSVLHDAKEFLAQNPPGVAQLYSKRKIFYNPSEFEKICYKELENEVFNF